MCLNMGSELFLKHRDRQARRGVVDEASLAKLAPAAKHILSLQVYSFFSSTLSRCFDTL